MHKLYYQPEGYWFGDCMPFYHDGKFYLFHQRDTRNPGPFGEPFGWALACTTDFVQYEDLGEAVKRGSDEEQDQYIFAGSLFEAKGLFYAMYTGFNRDYPKQGKASQVLMIANSTDLIHWNKTSEKLVVPQEGYDPNDWRDPYVFWNEGTQEFIMILGARKLEGKKIRTGRTVWFISTDLKKWDFKGDFWAPNLFCMHEMPDIFKMGEYWYLLTTEYSDKSKTVYRMSETLNGPWKAPVDDAFDGRAYYAARSYSDGDKRYLFGWVPTKENEDDLYNWQWGGTLVVHEVYQRADGTLGVRIPEGVATAFSQKECLTRSPVTLSAQDSCSEAYLTKNTGDLFKFEANIEFSADTRSFGIRIFEDEATGDAYEFIFQINENRLSFDRTPNLPWFRLMNRGLDRPIRFEPNTKYNLKIIVDETIATIYIDGVALNTRMYSKAGQALAVYVVDGKLTVEDAVIETGLR
ncbi:MAG: family 43 glycosylhydrolase [Anaerolineaceae bacterium]|nr:family 43 glycosylhydrolase [Anaerolineaceae bacterium]